MTTEFSDVEWTSYRVSGSTLREVAATISHLPEAGSAEWYPRYDCDVGEGGVVRSATVTVGLRITMPQWEPSASTSRGARDEWDRFHVALEAHERGHIDIAQAHLRNLDQQLVGESAAGARKVFDDVLGALHTASVGYDDQTDHGRNQGTIIDIDVDAESLSLPEWGPLVDIVEMAWDRITDVGDGVWDFVTAGDDVEE